MESFMDALGVIGVVFLVIVGAVAGAIAGAVTGRNMLLYIVVGILSALALPFLLAALGVFLAIGGGLLVILIVGALGALAILALIHLVRR